MYFAHLDASAGVKRYVPEPGSPVVHQLFAQMPLSRMVILSVGMAEVISILVRKYNGGLVSHASFQQAIALFISEIGVLTPVRVIDAIGSLAEEAYALIQQSPSTPPTQYSSAQPSTLPQRSGLRPTTYCSSRATSGCSKQQTPKD